MLLPSESSSARTGWGSLRQLTGYQWFVFIVCCLAWDMDCMDQQLFALARRPAMVENVRALLGEALSRQLSTSIRKEARHEPDRG